MNDTPGTCVFLSHLRRGIGTAVAAPQNSAPRATIQLTVPIAANGEKKEVVVEGLNLVGPGNVLGFDPRVIVRTYPQQDAFDAESNYFPLIEFSHPDLPWRYTPTPPDTEGRLSPWFCLIALKDNEFELDTANVGTPEKRLPVLTVYPTAPLPKLSQAWAWAHIQVSGINVPDLADPDSIRQILDNEPQRVVARLLCPRRLEPKTGYTVFVIPNYERGRLIGLPKEKVQQELQQKNLEWKNVAALERSWTDEEAATLPRSRTILMPVYYHWRFQTGEGGDFEYLVDLLIENNKKKNNEEDKEETKNSETVAPQKPSVGTRLMDVQTPGAGLPPASATPMGLEGALKVPDSGIPWVRKDKAGNELTGDQNIKTNWIARLSEITGWNWDGTLGLVASRAGNIVRTALLPIYGRWHIGANAQAPVNPTHSWFYELNIDPRLRVAAGLGTYVVQTQQQSLMASAWRQVEGIQKINTELRQTQLARETATRIYQSDIVADTHQTRQAEAILNLSAPVHEQVVWIRQPPVDGNPFSEETLRASTKTSRLADGIFDPQWRRIVRSRGPISQRQGRTGTSNILDRMNKEETDPNYLSPAKKPEPPSNILSFKSLGLDLVNLDSGQIGGSGGPHEYLPGTPFEQPREGNWDIFRQAIEDLIADDGWEEPKEPPHPPPIDITIAAKAVVKALDPVRTIETPCVDRLKGVDRSKGTWQGEDKLSPVMAEPTFPYPMIDPLRELSQDWILPGLDQVPPNTITLLEPNRKFIEAYMVGLNHEMARELLWNSYPTDQRGSYFRHFWPPTSIVNPKKGTVSPEAQSDINRINEWTGALGQNQPEGKGEALLCLLIRGDLLRRYPNAMIYASKATGSSENPQLITDSNHPNFDERYPLFIGTLKPDVSFLAFSLSEEEVRGHKATDTQPDEPGWFFVLQEQSFEGRFGLDIGSEEDYGQPVAQWNEFSWEHLVATPDELESLHYIDIESDRPRIKPSVYPGPERWHAKRGSQAAEIASITFQRPVRVAVHASDLLPTTKGADL